MIPLPLAISSEATSITLEFKIPPEMLEPTTLMPPALELMPLAPTMVPPLRPVALIVPELTTLPVTVLSVAVPVFVLTRAATEMPAANVELALIEPEFETLPEATKS
jgi:hypothetical protein